jgi:8-oxo-dGTP pyrophosphatase MutT (NUDIX family)
MTGSSILPVSIYKGKIFFLFGKETELEQTAKGFSDFGGGIEKGETIYDTAMREGAEELTGFLGNSNEIREYINNNGGVYPINYKNQYYIHIFVVNYDPNLPKYYNQNYHFLWEKMEPKELQKTKLFEKIEIKWFSTQEMMMKIKEFRPFYQKIVKRILKEIPQIKKFISQRTPKLKAKNKNKTKHVRWAIPLQQQRKTRRIDRTLTPYYPKKQA